MELKYGKVAIIMRTKDRNIFLKRAIESVINQNYKDWILAIVNDGGNLDDIQKLLKSYEHYKEKIIIIHNENSLGMEAASNRGIKSVNSDYVVIHDDDDTWESEFLSKTVNYLDENSNCNGVITYSNKIIEKINNKKIIIKKVKPFNTYLKGIISIYDLCIKNLFSPISFIYRRSVVDEIGLYDETLPVLGDWEFNLRFIKKYDIHIIEEKLANYHQRPQVKSGVNSNSIVGARKIHLYYETIIKNKLLRNDFASEKLGIGTIINLGRGYRNTSFIRRIRQKLNL
ncbi:glycosyltransferase family 2 protein [Clostridium botulinum]|uniref:Glycosyltransferase n=1 Tax=Clostridium botulinum TaxID=1491 RepID=A0A0L9Y756_CLOBO|nr:glycosyltransferase [Clostridium botulinum]EES49044.1 glycosyl transferase, family 2 [Clostridium botulinum E1 str. 'BoNT E Beluga']KAI3349202.1 glycosyltransferase [Clostridium botulinum]KOM87536.1 glycosyl transferase family 2 [Clostridium botulinum]KOR61543.1 glycosyl transferase family 2 [Clostridium botulinum]MBN1043379.1 glycosyltransferase [Clostridium botulinum]